MNPYGLILLFALALAGKAIADNYSGNKLSVTIVSIDSMKFSMEGLLISYTASVFNPASHSMKIQQVFTITTVNNTKTAQTQAYSKTLNAATTTTLTGLSILIPYAKVTTLVQAITLNQPLKTNASIQLEVQSDGWIGNGVKAFTLDNVPLFK